jgi:hypothetical protein
MSNRTIDVAKTWKASPEDWKTRMNENDPRVGTMQTIFLPIVDTMILKTAVRLGRFWLRKLTSCMSATTLMPSSVAPGAVETESKWAENGTPSPFHEPDITTIFWADDESTHPRSSCPYHQLSPEDCSLQRTRLLASQKNAALVRMSSSTWTMSCPFATSCNLWSRKRSFWSELYG